MTQTTNAKDKIAAEIVEIMDEYRAQDAKGYVDSPGGIEHKGDAFRLLRKWERMLKDEQT